MMHLTDEEQAMLAGKWGEGVRKAMEIVVALGRIYHAEDLVAVRSAQVSGVSYKNLGEAGLEFLEEWAAQGARTRVSATLNPAGMDLSAWRELGFAREFAGRQQRVISAYEALGVRPTCTCTPYLAGTVPKMGEHIAWAESSAVSYANSVLGARTNREGGPSALAAAISGRTARYGLHLDARRLATVVVDVRVAIRSEADVGALGYLVGRQVKNKVPLLRVREWELSDDDLKTLGAAMAASGAVALYHIAGVTPEAEAQNMVAPGAERVVVDSLEPAYHALDGSAEAVDLVSLGCPHASLAELEAIAAYLDERRTRTALWITLSRAIREAAETSGLVARLEATGARLVADTCMVVAPVDSLGFRTMATNSAKMAFYAPAHSGLSVRFGTTEQCLEAALSGRWAAS
jgi:predicted aconitase